MRGLHAMRAFVRTCVVGWARCLVVSTGMMLHLCFAQMYIDNREASVYWMQADAFVLNNRLYVIYDIDASMFFENGPPIPPSTIQMRILTAEICPTSSRMSTTWVGGYAVIYDKSKKLEVVLQAVEWLRNDEQNKLIVAFADQCEPDEEEPIDPMSAEDMVESFLVIDGYYGDIPIVLRATAGTVQKVSLQYLFLISTSTACEGSGSSDTCKWLRKNDPCREAGHDDDHARSCPTGPDVGFQYGRANVAASMACIHGFGYAIQDCLAGDPILLTAATSYAGDVEMVHIPGRSTRPHKANFEGRVKARLHCEVRRSGGLNFSTAVAGVGAHVHYTFTSDGKTRGQCMREMESAIQVGHRGTLRIPVPPRGYDVEASPGDKFESDKSILVKCESKCATKMSLTGETGAGMIIQAYMGRASACVKMDAEECYIRGTCRYSGDLWNIRRWAACCDANDDSNLYKCIDIFQ